MMRYHQIARIGAVYLLVKGAAFLAVAALGWTPLPPPLLGGMALTWAAGGILLGAQVRRVEWRLARERAEASAPIRRQAAAPAAGN